MGDKIPHFKCDKCGFETDDSSIKEVHDVREADEAKREAEERDITPDEATALLCKIEHRGYFCCSDDCGLFTRQHQDDDFCYHLRESGITKLKRIVSG